MHATFTGLIPIGVPLTSIAEVAIEFYRVFPKDSTDPPDGRVLTRANSPSDVEFADRDSADVSLSFAASVLNGTFTAQNSVVNGINALPNQKTGGEGPVTGQEVLIDVTFLMPVDLPADHYFFVPQVMLAGGNFLWLSASRPIVPPGTPFPLGTTDLQSWIRNADLDPDWSRIGTDIVGASPQGQPAPTFNAAFSLDGEVIPEPATLLLVGSGIALLGRSHRRRREKVAVSVLR